MIGLGWLRGWAQRKVATSEPDFIIGGADDPYLRRWYVIPRNRFFNVYLHHFLRDDDDRALHDHPWINCTILLDGHYYEVKPPRAGTSTDRVEWRSPGDIVLRLPSAAHRIVLPFGKPAISLFITGPRVREWGFHCPNGWVHWRDFTAGPNGETVGKGCDQ